MDNKKQPQKIKANPQDCNCFFAFFFLTHVHIARIAAAASVFTEALRTLNNGLI